MASTFEFFHSFRQYIADGTIDLDSTDIYLALVTSAYTKDLTDTIWSEVSGSEAATGDGYTTGGAQLASNDVTYTTVTGKFDATDVSWAALTKTFRFGVLYSAATVGPIVKPLIAIITFDSTPADIAISGATFTVSWNASGIFTIT
jgi:hypothetical protein